MFLSVERVKEGLDMYMAGEAWDKAREIARNIAPRSNTHTHTHTQHSLHTLQREEVMRFSFFEFFKNVHGVQELCIQVHGCCMRVTMY